MGGCVHCREATYREGSGGTIMLGCRRGLSVDEVEESVIIGSTPVVLVPDSGSVPHIPGNRRQVQLATAPQMSNLVS